MTNLSRPADASVSLEVRDVHKGFETAHDQVEVLRGISFEMAVGESLAITGPSGSGKSTLLHLIGTLDQPSAGTVLIGGEDHFALPEPELARFRNRTIGFIFQDHHLLPQYSVLENVLIPTLVYPDKSGQSARDQSPRDQSPRDHGLELLDRVGLSNRLEHRPAELSGGERQRVAVARALINRPSLLLCDEPTGSLDQTTADAVGDLLLELHGEDRTVLIVVTHSQELAGRFERRLDLKEGRCFVA